jgi:hypothetical protein
MSAKDLILNYSVVILSALSTTVSIIGIFKAKGIRFIRYLYTAIAILATATAIVFYWYSEAVNKKLDFEKRRVEIRVQAKKIVHDYNYVSYFEPGKSEGLIFSTLSLLERNQDVNPELYSIYKEIAITRLKNLDALGETERKQRLEISGNAALQILKDLSK